MLIGAFLSTGIFALFFGISLLSAPGFAPIGGALLIALGIGLACVAVSAAFIPDSHGKRPLPSSQHATRDEAGGRE